MFAFTVILDVIALVIAVWVCVSLVRGRFVFDRDRGRVVGLILLAVALVLVSQALWMLSR